MRRMRISDERHAFTQLTCVSSRDHSLISWIWCLLCTLLAYCYWRHHCERNTVGVVQKVVHSDSSRFRWQLLSTTRTNINLHLHHQPSGIQENIIPIRYSGTKSKLGFTSRLSSCEEHPWKQWCTTLKTQNTWYDCISIIARGITNSYTVPRYLRIIFVYIPGTCVTVLNCSYTVLVDNRWLGVYIIIRRYNYTLPFRRYSTWYRYLV